METRIDSAGVNQNNGEPGLKMTQQHHEHVSQDSSCAIAALGSATQVAETEEIRDFNHELCESAKVWQDLQSRAETARSDERKAHYDEDSSRWQQAQIVVDLHSRWGKQGLTYEEIASAFNSPVSTIKLFAGTQREFANRTDLARRRFSDWQKIFIAIRSEIKRIQRMVTDDKALEKLTAAVKDKLPGVIDGVVADENLTTTRDFGQKAKDNLRKLVHSEHARLFPPPRISGDPLRLADGVELLEKQDNHSVSMFVLDAPYGTHADTRGLQMANNTPEETRDLLIEIVPIIPRKLTDNGFVFWFRPGFLIDGTDDLKPILAEWFCLRQLVWIKSRTGLANEGKNIGLCHELIYMLWPKDRSLPVPHVHLPDCLHISHDEMSDPNSPNPSAKPVALFEKLIEATTMPGDLVVDSFAGSGACVSAALKLGRRIVAAEIVPEIFQLAQRQLTECRAALSSDPTTAAFAAERGIEVL